MFNKDVLFGRKDEGTRNDVRTTNVNVTPDLQPEGLLRAQQPGESAKSDRSYGGDPKARPQREEPAGSKLIVGPDIKLKGVEITDCDTLVVEGRVEASMDSRVVQIAQNGVFTGNATMDVAEIWGAFEGQLTVRKHLVIYASGRVSGNIRYGQIRIEEGGELAGEVSTLAPAQNAAAPRRSETAAGKEGAEGSPVFTPGRTTARPEPKVSAAPNAGSPAPVRPGAAASR